MLLNKCLVQDEFWGLTMVAPRLAQETFCRLLFKSVLHSSAYYVRRIVGQLKRVPTYSDQVPLPTSSLENQIPASIEPQAHQAHCLLKLRCKFYLD